MINQILRSNFANFQLLDLQRQQTTDLTPETTQITQAQVVEIPDYTRVPDNYYLRPMLPSTGAIRKTRSPNVAQEIQPTTEVQASISSEADVRREIQQNIDGIDRLINDFIKVAEENDG